MAIALKEVLPAHDINVQCMFTSRIWISRSILSLPSPPFLFTLIIPYKDIIFSVAFVCLSVWLLAILLKGNVKNRLNEIPWIGPTW